MNDLDHRDHLETVCAELIDAELDAVSGAVSDLGKYITKAVDDAISAAIGGNAPPGNGPGVYPLPAYSPKSVL